MQKASNIHAKFSKLFDKMFIFPEQEDGSCCRGQRNILVACCLSRLQTLVDRVIITNGERQFPNFGALKFNGKWGKTMANLACVEHPNAAPTAICCDPSIRSH